MSTMVIGRDGEPRWYRMDMNREQPCVLCGMPTDSWWPHGALTTSELDTTDPGDGTWLCPWCTAADKQRLALMMAYTTKLTPEAWQDFIEGLTVLGAAPAEPADSDPFSEPRDGLKLV